MDKVIGECSQCGGRVMSNGVCSNCKATVKRQLPVIETEGGDDPSAQPGGGRVQQQWER